MTYQKPLGRLFTLVELIAIVLVVAVLTLLSVPVLSMAREKARRVNCAGNLKSIGLGSLMYSGDFDGYFPQFTPTSSTNFEPMVAEGYIQDGKVWACPSADVVLITGANSAYRYIGSGLKDDNATARSSSLAYDKSGNHPANAWVNLLFIDGHVEGGKQGSSRVDKGEYVIFNND